MDLQRARRILSVHEGRRNTLYKDSLGYLTIGVGHLIDPAKGGTLPEPIIDALLDWDMGVAWRALLAANPWLDRLDDVRQYVLLDMCFNLGPEPFDHDGFKDWPIFMKQVQLGAYHAAAENMRSTLWAKQVGTRATRLASMMETGEWPSDV